MTYALAPLFSCLYFDPKFTAKMSIFSYIVMAAALYFNCKGKYEVVYQGRSHIAIYIAYLIGFTIEYAVVNMILGFIVVRARKIMEERYSAEEANRMKSRFLSNMSHEIRTPMNAILGMAEVSLRQDMSSELRKNIGIIKSSSMGLLEIINDILDLSKIEAGKLSIIENDYSTAALAEDMKAIIDARNIDPKAPIYYHIQEDMPKALSGDAVRIKQVMMNFASNAIKYTETGRIDISLGCTQKDGYAELSFSVKDTGQGIKQEDMGRLFTMYTQLNAEENHSKEGTGIGLAISKYFIDSMNGTISAESVYGKGSTFSFTVPQKIAETVPESDDDDDDVMFSAKGVRLLIVDDNEINREVVRAILEPAEPEMDEAANGLEAVKMAKEKQYDIIFMDSHMPVMNGEEATRAIRASEGLTDKSVPIIALTADAVKGVREQLISSGMTDYIAKPVDVRTIYRKMKKYLPDKITLM